MGFFDKKYCDICGEKIGLLGNRKLEDGNLCKSCAAKLSPWFSERRSSTVDEIKSQLEYRKENLETVKVFNVTRSMGRDTKVLFDEDARKFTITRARNLEDANPDILDFSQITGCDFEIRESKDEQKEKDENGHYVSYVPPRYEYEYDFYITAQVNHPYFNEMNFKLNPSSVSTGNRSINDAPKPTGSMVFAQVDPNAIWNEDYKEYYDMGNEIKKALLWIKDETHTLADLDANEEPEEAPAEESAPAEEAVQEPVAQEPAAPASAICPHCGAPAIPDANGCCEFCGGRL